ncbi:hypothetical protein EVAR_9597_1 [Eumeta japonica]|uniref:Uncharacterized protein n=1 Tax=Eumeta variegata TaxID=151549 RepID=A0A4C1TJG9_EUMVA|nr:hypothetical protein EVAR_9597_1 [Eumeta japonica]
MSRTPHRYSVRHMDESCGKRHDLKASRRARNAQRDPVGRGSRCLVNYRMNSNTSPLLTPLGDNTLPKSIPSSGIPNPPQRNSVVSGPRILKLGSFKSALEEEMLDPGR